MLEYGKDKGMDVNCETVEAGSGKVAMREGNISLWQVQVLSHS